MLLEVGCWRECADTSDRDEYLDFRLIEVVGLDGIDSLFALIKIFKVPVFR